MASPAVAAYRETEDLITYVTLSYYIVHIIYAYIYIHVCMYLLPPMIHSRSFLKGVDHGRGDIYTGGENIARLQFNQNSQNLSNCGPALPVDVNARILGILWTFQPGDFFASQALQALGKFEPGDVVAMSDAKTSQAFSFPKTFKLNIDGPINATILRTLGKIRAWRCFRSSSFTNFGEIQTWRLLGNIGCENIVRLEFPQNLQSWTCKNIARLEFEPKFPKSQQLWPPLRIDARVLVILGNFLRFLGNVGSENSARLEFHKNFQTEH